MYNRIMWIVGYIKHLKPVLMRDISFFYIFLKRNMWKVG